MFQTLLEENHQRPEADAESKLSTGSSPSGWSWYEA
jgi:hypothetical protein